MSILLGPILLSLSCHFQSMPSLSVNVGGLILQNPIMLAAGILGTTGASLRRAALAGAGCVVTKSIGSVPREGHPGPTVVQVECGLLNAMGLPNPGFKDFQEEIDVARTGGVPVVASIFGSSAAEFARIARGLKPDAFELNLSCPHAEKYGSELGRYPDLVESVTGAVKASANVPVWVKLTPNTADIVELGLAAQRAGADGVVAINTLKAMAIDIEAGFPILGNKFGGLSGSAIKPVAIKCVYDLASNLDIPVIGVGGVSSWEDAVEMIMAGARGVQIGTALYRGYDIFKEITDGLSRYLDRKSLTLNDLCAVARRHS
jgi:dihydroorotate dehydrogenase (NAD+) catalytic subunit